MLEGLEVAEVTASEVFAATPTMRFDPEYFRAANLKDEALVSARANDFQSFADLGLTVDASAFYPSIEGYYGEGNLPFLRVADVDSKLCDMYPTLSCVEPGDILFTKGGSVARVGLATRRAAVSRDLIFLNSSKLPREEQAFLYLYSQTPFFNRVLLRSSSQTAQPHLTITLVRELRVLKASHRLKEKTLAMVNKAFAAHDLAREHQVEAENTLLIALGLKNWRTAEPLSYVRTSSQAFAAGRLDAEFFRPRVLSLMTLLSKDGLTLGSVAPARHEAFEPERFF